MGSKTYDTDTLLEAIKDGYGAAVSSRGDGLLRRDLSTNEVRNLVFRLDALLRAGGVLGSFQTVGKSVAASWTASVSWRAAGVRAATTSPLIAASMPVPTML